MATAIGTVLGLIESAWQLSLAFIPLMYLAFLGHGLARDREDLLATVVHSQRTYTLHYGLYVIAGLFVGGAWVTAFDGVGSLIAGGVAAAAATAYGVATLEEPGIEPLDLSAWPDRLMVPWVLVPPLAAAAILTGNPLLQSAVALLFLSAVFWEV